MPEPHAHSECTFSPLLDLTHTLAILAVDRRNSKPQSQPQTKIQLQVKTQNPQPYPQPQNPTLNPQTLP